MTAETIKELKLFYCYAREDKILRDKLDTHLSIFKRLHHIKGWSDREISPGVEWQKEIDLHLNTAHIILLLVSPNFMASDYCYGIEMKRALERHETGEARVIPIILRPVDWKDAPFSKLQVLPFNAKPVTRWQDRDQAFLDIAGGIRAAVDDLIVSLNTKQERLEEEKVLRNLEQREETLVTHVQDIKPNHDYATNYNNRGITLKNLKRYEEALAAYDQAIKLDSNYTIAYYNKGNALSEQRRYEEALAAYDQAIKLDPDFADAYYNKGSALNDLKRYEEALAAYDQAIKLDPNDVYAYNGRGITLKNLKRYEEALAAYNQAIKLDSDYKTAYYNKGNALQGLECYEEALAAYDQAIKLDPNFADAYHNKGNALNGLKRYDEALAAFDQAAKLEASS